MEHLITSRKDTGPNWPNNGPNVLNSNTFSQQYNSLLTQFFSYHFLNYSVSMPEQKSPLNPAGMHFCLYNNEIKQFRTTRMPGCVLQIQSIYEGRKLWEWVWAIHVPITVLKNVSTRKHSPVTSSPWLKATTIKIWKNKCTQSSVICKEYLMLYYPQDLQLFHTFPVTYFLFCISIIQYTD